MFKTKELVELINMVSENPKNKKGILRKIEEIGNQSKSIDNLYEIIKKYILLYEEVECSVEKNTYNEENNIVIEEKKLREWFTYFVKELKNKKSIDLNSVIINYIKSFKY